MEEKQFTWAQKMWHKKGSKLKRFAATISQTGQKLPKLKERKKAVLYKNCRELPIHNFNEVVLTSDLSYLVKESGSLEGLDLEDKWIEILDEWNGFFNDSKRGIKQKCRKLQNQNKLFYLNIIKEIDGVVDDEDLSSFLSVFRLSKKNYIMRINTITNRLNSTKTESVQENTFDLDNTLAVLSENGMKLNRFEDTISLFASCLLRLKKKANTRNG